MSIYIYIYIYMYYSIWIYILLLWLYVLTFRNFGNPPFSVFCGFKLHQCQDSNSIRSGGRTLPCLLLLSVGGAYLICQDLPGQQRHKKKWRLNSTRPVTGSNRGQPARDQHKKWQWYLLRMCCIDAEPCPTDPSLLPQLICYCATSISEPWWYAKKRAYQSATLWIRDCMCEYDFLWTSGAIAPRLFNAWDAYQYGTFRRFGKR